VVIEMRVGALVVMGVFGAVVGGLVGVVLLDVGVGLAFPVTVFMWISVGTGVVSGVLLGLVRKAQARR
jgi:hypothetical protein